MCLGLWKNLAISGDYTVKVDLFPFSTQCFNFDCDSLSVEGCPEIDTTFFEGEEDLDITMLPVVCE